MSFYEIKQPWTQTQDDDCVPTCLRVMLNNQFDVKKSHSTIKTWTNYTPGYGCPTFKALRDAEPFLSKHEITVKEKGPASEDEIVQILKEGKLPLVFLPFSYLKEVHKLSEEGLESIDEEGDEWSHAVLIQHIDLERGKVYIYDPLINYGNIRLLKKEDVKVILSLPVFLKYWTENLNKVFWLESKKPDKAITRQLKLSDVKK